MTFLKRQNTDGWMPGSRALINTMQTGNQRGNTSGSNLERLAPWNRASQLYWRPFWFPSGLVRRRKAITVRLSHGLVTHASGSSSLLVTKRGQPAQSRGSPPPPHFPLLGSSVRGPHSYRVPGALVLYPHPEIPPQKLVLPLATSFLSKRL